MFDLGGKTALVTGATGGIGGAIARALHAQGARVALSGTRREVLDQTAAELGGAPVLPCDLANKESVEALIPDAEKALGSAAKTVFAEYYAPHLAHAPMEPTCATARVAGSKCEVWAAVQSPGARRTSWWRNSASSRRM